MYARGATPTTVYGSPFSRSAVPTTPGSAPRRIHRGWLSTTARPLPGRSSPGRSQRPSAGRISAARKKSAVTRPPYTRSGSCPGADRVKVPPSNAASDSNEVLRARQSEKCPAETGAVLPCQVSDTTASRSASA